MQYQITLKSTGEQFSANADETLLDAALRQGHTLPYGCRNGACGACIATIISGEINYEDPDSVSALKKIENNQALICQARASSDLVIDSHEIEQGQDSLPIEKMPCRLVEKQQLAHDVMLLKLKTPDNKRLQFFAGQYIDFILKTGEHRSFSLANAPHNDKLLELHIRHIEGGEFTDFVFNKLQEKAILRIEGPLGTFFLREKDQRPLIFLAGGTGFAPIKSLIEHAIHQQDPRSIHFYWGARAKRDLYMDELAKTWATQPNIDYSPVLSAAQDDDNWSGKTGFVHSAVLADYPDLSNYAVYVCGPPPMVNAAHQAFIKQGLPEEYFYSDSFEFNRQPSEE